MTRKRFIKLAMSYGLPRNSAHRLSGRVAEYGSYKEMYEARRYIWAANVAAKAIIAGLRAGIMAPPNEAISKAARSIAKRIDVRHVRAIAICGGLENNPHMDGLNAETVIVDEMHEWRGGIDLANGPDFTAVHGAPCENK